MKSRSSQIAGAAIAFSLMLLMGGPSQSQDSGAQIDSLSSTFIAVHNATRTPVKVWVGPDPKSLELLTVAPGDTEDVDCSDTSTCYLSLGRGYLRVEPGNRYAVQWDGAKYSVKKL